MSYSTNNVKFVVRHAVQEHLKSIAEQITSEESIDNLMNTVLKRLDNTKGLRIGEMEQAVVVTLPNPPTIIPVPAKTKVRVTLQDGEMRQFHFELLESGLPTDIYLNGIAMFGFNEDLFAALYENRINDAEKEVLDCRHISKKSNLRLLDEMCKITNNTNDTDRLKRLAIDKFYPILIDTNLCLKKYLPLKYTTDKIMVEYYSYLETDPAFDAEQNDHSEIAHKFEVYKKLCDIALSDNSILGVITDSILNYMREHFKGDRFIFVE